MKVSTHLTRPLLFAFVLAGCGGPQSAARPDAPTDPSLVGRWRSGCVDPGTGQAIRLTFDITSTTWALDYESFGDAACAQPLLVVDITGAYQLTVPSAVVPGASEARFGFATKTVTPLAEGALGFLTQACGRSDFQVGVASDIAAGCAGLGAYPIAQCPDDYDLVRRDGTGLQFGARPTDNNMCTPDRRPTQLSPVLLTLE